MLLITSNMLFLIEKNFDFKSKFEKHGAKYQKRGRNLNIKQRNKNFLMSEIFSGISRK